MLRWLNILLFFPSFLFLSLANGSMRWCDTSSIPSAMSGHIFFPNNINIRSDKNENKKQKIWNGSNERTNFKINEKTYMSFNIHNSPFESFRCIQCIHFINFNEFSIDISGERHTTTIARRVEREREGEKNLVCSLYTLSPVKCGVDKEKGNLHVWLTKCLDWNSWKREEKKNAE